MVKPEWELISAPNISAFIFRVREQRDGEWFAGWRYLTHSVDLMNPEVVADLIASVRLSPVKDKQWN